MSLYERMNPGTFVSAATKASPNDLAKALGASVTVSRDVVHKHLTTAFGESPGLVWVLELITLIMPTVTLGLVYGILRREAQGPFNVRSELILFGNLYWGGYYFILTMATLISYKEPPLAVFAQAYPEQYAHYQVCVSLLFVCYLWTLCRHLYVERTQYAWAQAVGTGFVFMSQYACIVYPATAENLPPVCGWVFYLLWTLIFAVLTVLIRHERKGKDE